MNAEQIAILGGGNMGRALIGGLLRRGVHAEHIAVGEASDAARTVLSRDFGVTASADNLNVVANASFIVISVKPQDVGAALPPLAPILRKNHAIVLSVAAGIRTASLEKWCGDGVPIVRAMPNRPALIGAGTTALFATARVKDAEKKRAENIIRAVGDAVWVENEEQLDIVTALSGTGPAYYFLLTEAMTQAAADLGLPHETARQLAIGTLRGAGLLAYGSDGDIVRLRNEVTSKGGTTEAALRVFEAAQFRELIARVIDAATRRSRELGSLFGENP